MGEREAYYDEHIAGRLKEIADDCRDHGLSFLAVVEYEPHQHGRTISLRENHGLGIGLANVAAQADGNVDLIIGAIRAHGEKVGHRSVYLTLLGVPAAPPKGEKR